MKTIGILDVIGDGDGFDLVVLVTDISANNPFADRGTLAVAKVQTLPYGGVIWLPTGLEPGPSSPGVELAIPHPLGRETLPLSNGVQYACVYVQLQVATPMDSTYAFPRVSNVYHRI